MNIIQLNNEILFLQKLLCCEEAIVNTFLFREHFQRINVANALTNIFGLTIHTPRFFIIQIFEALAVEETELL